MIQKIKDLMIELRFDEAMALAIKSWQDCTEEDKPKLKNMIRAIHYANIFRVTCKIALDLDKSEMQRQIEICVIAKTPPPFHLLKESGGSGKSVRAIGKRGCYSETVNHVSELKMLKQLLK